MKAITTTYQGSTYPRGSRITANDGDGNRITVPRNGNLNTDAAHAHAALALCKKMNWLGQLVQGETRTSYVHVFLPYSINLHENSRIARRDDYMGAVVLL